MKLLYTPPGPEAEVAGEPIHLLPQITVPAEPDPAEPKVVKEERVSEIIIIESKQAWDLALKEIYEAGICGLDLETTGLDPLVARMRLIQLAIPGKVFVADVHALDVSALNDLARLMENEHVKKVIHNAKFELSMIQAPQTRRLRAKNIFCTMLASQVCWSGYYELVPAPKAKKFPWKRNRTKQSLEALVERHLGVKMDKSFQTSDWSAETLSPVQIKYAAKDAEVLLPLHDILQELLRKNKLEHIADLEFKTLPAVVEVELTGLPIDANATMAMMEVKRSQALDLMQELQEVALMNGFLPRPKKGKKPQQLLNPGSRIDILEYLQHQGYNNILSTKEEDLKALKFPWADKLLRYRRVSRQRTFLEKWLIFTSAVDERLHAKYRQCSTVSGRFTSAKPNAQQIPKSGEDGKAIRKLFKAVPGRKIVKADFSGIELRIMARLSGDKTMTEAFKAGQDLHKLTASKMAGVPLDQVTKEQRQSAKGVNFGLIYGASAPRLQASARDAYGVEMSLEEAEKNRRTFFTTYQGVARWHYGQRLTKNRPKVHYFHDAKRGFYNMSLVSSQTVSGRKRVWGWFWGRTLARDTELYNSPCQGTGADLIKFVMAELYDLLCNEGFEDVRMVGTIHDELLLEAPEDRAEEMGKILLDIMRRVGSTLLDPVPVDAEISVAPSWGGD
ncbi:MAG: DNA polymerase [Methanothrix sp.]